MLAQSMFKYLGDFRTVPATVAFDQVRRGFELFVAGHPFRRVAQFHAIIRNELHRKLTDG